MSGEIKNDSATRSNTKSDSQSASSAVSASASCSVTNVGKYVATAEAEATADSWGVPTLHSSSASASVTTSVSATTQADPNAADVANFNAAMVAAEKWSNDMVNWINGIPTFISGSDKVGRNINNSTVTSPFIVSKKELTTTQCDTGYLTISTPDDWFKVKDDGAGDSFNIVSYSLSMSAKNPVDVTATKTGSDSDSDSDSKPCSYVAPTENSPGTLCGKEMAQAGAVHAHSKISVTAQPDPTKTWSATVTFTLKPHVLCGPDCGHELPEINDIWQQSFNYDYLKIIGLSVLRLDQGSANDETGRGLNALIGTKKLGVTRQTYYSSPTMSLAQANIFNYMGLQTDGTKDVYNATNEYFRSIAYGVGTTYGNTKSAEANRVQYYMTDADGDVLSVKGTDDKQFPRYENKGNQEVKTSFDNELRNATESSWGTLTDGIVDAGDYVYYDFGPRSNLSDGTSRGYKYNMDKRSWVEKVNGNYRGKAAYDLSWAKGFIYDGIQKNGKIDASGFVSRSLRNSGGGEMGGIYQGVGNGDGVVKGWQGTGMTTTTLQFKTISYEAPFEAGFFTGQNDEMKKAYGEGDFTKFSTTDETPPKGILYQPAVRDWSKTNHALYSDTRNLLEPAGFAGCDSRLVATRSDG